ncbi:hypothetical protein ABZW49_39055 [Nonomuraea wenchangensis]
MQFGILGPLEVRPAGGPALAYWPARRVRRRRHRDQARRAVLDLTR